MHNSSHVVTVGQRFAYRYADTEILFTIVRVAESVVYAKADENNWGITERPFAALEAARLITWAQVFQTAIDASEDFWESVEVGSVIHQYFFSTRFIRGVVVDDSGTKKMRALSLVGDWDDYELPQRSPDGSIDSGFHAKAIIDGELTTPQPERIWEFMSDESKNNRYLELIKLAGGPSALPAIDLSVPAMTQDEERAAQSEILLKMISEATYEYQVPLSQRLDTVRKLLTQIEELV